MSWSALYLLVNKNCPYIALSFFIRFSLSTSTCVLILSKFTFDSSEQDALQPEIDLLLKLKAEYKTITGSDYQAPGAGSCKKDKKNKENKQPKQPKENKKEKKEKAAAATATTPDDGQKQKQTRLGVEFKKTESLPDWYSQVCFLDFF